MTVWRWIPPFAASGAVQMALDAWLFEQYVQGNHPPTLRFYTWEPAAISLGYHQRHYPDHWNDLMWRGRSLEIVQRPTGGRAVLHQGDLTYAVITSGLSGNRMESYRQICEFLILGWRSLGIELHYGTTGRGYIHNPNCFGTATTADLVLPNGSKLIGSAQLRRGNAILQHGSMRLNPDRALFQQVFQPGSSAPSSPDCLPPKISMEPVIAALMESAKACFAIDFFPIDFKLEPLSDSEWKILQNLFETPTPNPTFPPLPSLTAPVPQSGNQVDRCHLL